MKTARPCPRWRKLCKATRSIRKQGSPLTAKQRFLSPTSSPSASPIRRPPDVAFLQFLISEERSADAAQPGPASSPITTQINKIANEYVSFLLKNNQPEAASHAWVQYAANRDPNYPDTTVSLTAASIAPTGSQFDWTVEEAPGANIDFDKIRSHAGSRSLRIDFNGAQNLSSVGLHQTVFLKPGRYRFHAYVRSNDLSTDEGISFRVANERAPKNLSFTTEPVLGSHDWTLVQHSFVVSPAAAGLIHIRLVRTPSLRFDNLIKGTLWIDDVSISPEPTRDLAAAQLRR